MTSSNLFATLATRIQQGDAAARNQLQRQLVPEMVRIVRCVVHHRRDQTALDRRILAEACRVGLDGPHSPEDQERLIRVVAQNLCDSVIAQLRSERQRRSDDTVFDSRYAPA